MGPVPDLSVPSFFLRHHRFFSFLLSFLHLLCNASLLIYPCVAGHVSWLGHSRIIPPSQSLDMDIRFGGRGRSNSRISRNDVLATDSNHSDNIINDQNDAYDTGNSAIEAPFSPSITKWDSVHSLSNVKTPARSFYHRAFHGSLGWFPSVFSIDQNSSDAQTFRSCAIFFSWRP